MRNASKNIAVTGGHGKIGKILVPYLRTRGYDVFSIDRDPPSDLEEPIMQLDLEDFGQTLDALSSVGKDVYARAESKAFDAIVHTLEHHPRMIADSLEFR